MRVRGFVQLHLYEVNKKNTSEISDVFFITCFQQMFLLKRFTIDTYCSLLQVYQTQIVLHLYEFIKNI
jgi:hypothetical protein